MKSVVALIMLLCLAVPMALPMEEYCSEGDDCCESPCADCYYHQCTCSLTFSALPVTTLDFSAFSRSDNAAFMFDQTLTSAGYTLLPDLPPRLS